MESRAIARSARRHVGPLAIESGAAAPFARVTMHGRPASPSSASIARVDVRVSRLASRGTGDRSTATAVRACSRPRHRGGHPEARHGELPLPRCWQPGMQFLSVQYICMLRRPGHKSMRLTMRSEKARFMLCCRDRKARRGIKNYSLRTWKKRIGCANASSGSE